MIEKLTNLKMIAKESVIDYIARADELQSNLREVDEQVSEPMVISFVLKGLTDDFDNFVTNSVKMNKIWILIKETE